MAIMVEKISAVTFRVSNMRASEQFYRDVLGMELLYGGETAGFSSLRAKHANSAILNLEQGKPVKGWGRLIFHVADVDALWRRFNELGFKPEKPQNASWGERYFHMLDPDGHVVVCVPVAANGMNMANHRKPLPENEHKKKPSASVPKAWGGSFRGNHFFISSFFVLSFISPFPILTDTT